MQSLPRFKHEKRLKTTEEGSSTYLENLLYKMNKPNPLDVNYLEKSIESFENQKLGNVSAQLEDIPEVYQRLYEDGLRKRNKQFET